MFPSNCLHERIETKLLIWIRDISEKVVIFKNLNARTVLPVVSL